MKRLISVLLCMVLALSCTMLASAATLIEEKDLPIQVYTAYTSSTKTLISISGGQATCTGSITGYQGTTTKVEITLTLQRKLSTSSTWTDFYIHPKQTFNNYKGTAYFTKDIVKGYQYRTKAVYIAYAGTKSETFTEYSGALAY